MTTALASFVALAIGLFAFWIALPREGRVRPFLRHDAAQAYYMVAVIFLLTLGVAGLANAVVSLQQ